MRLMVDHLGLRQLWAGFDFALGRNREGNIPTLRTLGQEMGYQLRVIPEVTVEDMHVSSSRIRALIKEGQVAQAAVLLGRHYTLTGPVIHGDGRGKGIGIPTANIDYWSEKMIPANGVYATWAWVDRQRLPSVTNIGTRPTFQGTGARVETHLMQYDRDLYGKSVTLEFLEFIRPEEKFPSIDALVAQIQQDKRTAEEILSHDA